LIAGRYEVAGRPMMGGMGIVYVCLDRKENRPVALKAFKPEYLPDRAARDRFLREGTAWVDLGVHPHVVRCYEVECIGDGTEVYLVLELIAKEQNYPDASLRSWLIPGRPLPVKTALPFALQIARGLQHAVERLPGFVHRDLKPENVLVDADQLPGWSVNRLRVTDFGLATVLAASAQPSAVSDQPGPTPDPEYALRHTQLTRGIVGTPLYMAPEQWRGEPVGVYTDVYALGCILYELLTGQRAVTGKTIMALRRAHCVGEIQALPDSVLAPVRELVTRCVVLDPAARYAEWAIVETDLAATLAAMTGRDAPVPVTAAALSREERVVAGWSYCELGVSYLNLGKAEVAVSYSERARAVSIAEGDRPLEWAALTHLGLAYAGLGDARHALGYHEQALAIACEIGGRLEEGHALGNLGSAYLQLGDTRRAIGYFEQALAIHREIGDRPGEGNDLGGLGVAYKNLGEARHAIEYYEQQLAIAHELGDRRREGMALGNLGAAYLLLGEVQRAIGYDEYALAIDREIGDRRGEGAVLGNLGLAYWQLGDARRAVGYYEQAVAVAREIGDRREEETILGNLGSAYLLLGDARRALGHFEQALAIAREIGNAIRVAYVSFRMAFLYAQQGDVAHALPLAQEAARIYTQIGHAQHAQRAQELIELITQPQGSESISDSLSPAQILQLSAPVIRDAVAATQGNHRARAKLNNALGMLEQSGWHITDPIRRIWAGERDEAALTAGIDANSALIVREILRQLQG